MAVKFNVSEAKLNVTIELTDITDEVYRDIAAYISMRTDEQKTTTATAASAMPAAVTASKTTSRAREKKTVDQKKKRCWGKHPDLLRTLDDYFSEAEASPDNYEIALMTSAEFIEHFPEFSILGNAGIGQYLKNRCKPGTKVIRASKSGNYGPYATFYVPIKKKKETPVGNAIRQAREDSRLTVKELADLIGYSPDIVKKWESGEYVPSSDAVLAIKTCFGADCFKGLE